MTWELNAGRKRQSRRPARSKRVINELIALVGSDLGYNDEGKARFHDRSNGILYALAQSLGYKPDEFEVRHNLGGIAVSGEITLHSDSLYVQFSQTCLGRDMGFMWRTCRGRKDYTGGPNQWAKWDELHDLDKLARKMLDQVERRNRVDAQLLAEVKPTVIKSPMMAFLSGKCGDE
jgi:hypothetical protein